MAVGGAVGAGDDGETRYNGRSRGLDGDQAQTVSASLLSTKFYIPPTRAKAVTRPRLVEKLLAGASRAGSLILLSGPAGFGKTTLLSEWVAQLQRPVAWVSLDESDNDPGRFWAYLVAACQAAGQAVGDEALALLRASQPLPPEAIPTLLINDFTRLGASLVLILDDYHVIQNQSIQAACAFMLEHLPAGLAVVVATRVDPPWPLARLRARNQLVELRAADLRFTPEEAAVFLNGCMGLNLPVAAAAALAARTEGWVAGLQLAAIAVTAIEAAAPPDALSAFVQAFAGSHVYVAEYLVEEVLQRQAEPVQAFLLQTSILRRLSAPLCEAVTGRQDGQTMLTALRRANLFVLPLDPEGQWFRYHHLFADLLQARLRQTVPDDVQARLHQRAAAWFEANGFAVEAVHHALEAKDFEGAARLVELNAYALTMRGELATLLQWLGALPAEVSQRHPQTLIAGAWALTLAGDVRQVQALLQQMEAELPGDRPAATHAELRGNAAAIRAFFFTLAGDYAQALELAERAEALLPESSIQARSVLPYTRGSAYRGQGNYEKAAEAFAHEARWGETQHDLLIWATGATEMVNVGRLRGRLREAAETGHQALQRLAQQGALPYGSLAKLEVALSEVLREQDELAEAHRRLTDVIGRMQTWAMPTDRLFAYLAIFRVQEAQGDLSAARETLGLAQAVKAAYPVLLFLARSVDLYAVRLALATNDLATAGRLAEGLAMGEGGTAMMHELEQVLLARVRLAQGRAAEAAASLSALTQAAEAEKHWGTWLECLALQACALAALGDEPAALAVLRRALAWGEPEGFVRVFVDEGARMQTLLRTLAAQPAAGGSAPAPSPAYLAKLLAAFVPSPPAARAPRPAAEPAGRVEPLTARELEVLRLIAAGDSNQVIADKLVITVSAVKKHAGNIFGKLSVSSRTQAIVCARQLGLLAADE